MTKKLTGSVNIRFIFVLFIFLPVVVMSQLHADFSATPLAGCAPMVINFTDNSTGTPTSWSWDFGNGTSSNIQNPVTSYFNSGTYNVKLVVTNANGADSLVKSQYVVVNALPVAAFDAPDTTGCSPFNVSFTDRSLAVSGTISSWQWDFGDGALSNEQNPVHIYDNAGNYNVVLKVTNNYGCSQFISKSSYIKTKNKATADFSYLPVQSCSIPATVNFTNKTISTDSLTYKWDFGDGNTSNQQNPLNNYQIPGVYTVRLIAVNNYGCADTSIKPNAVNITSVKADFTLQPVACIGSSFQLTNASIPTSFVSSFWDFGDGTTSTLSTPLKSYALPGIYQIKMVTDFGLCKDSTMKSITISDKPKPDFTSANNTNCNTPSNVTFNNITPNGVSYLWNFGDGSTSALQNLVHTYAGAGVYTVTLTATNSAGCTDFIVKPNFVQIIPPQITSINKLPARGCIPLTITPIAIIQSSQPVKNYFWDFGDGGTSFSAAPFHKYTKRGNYKVKLVISTATGCTDSLTIDNAVLVGTKPKAGFSSDTSVTCASNLVTFKDLSAADTITNWLWTFGDGGTSYVRNPVYKFTNAGTFKVGLVVTSYGCSDSLIKNNFIKILPPLASFSTNFICSSPFIKTFTALANAGDSRTWDFGDSTLPSSKDTITHTYAMPGIYPVTLKVTNGGCKDAITIPVRVIDEHGMLQVKDSLSCINAEINFSVTNINPANIGSYAWYFNGLTQPADPATANPVITKYPKSGTYPAAAVITDILNCRDTLYPALPVAIYGPKADFTNSGIRECLGNTTIFNDSTKTDGIHNITKWSWNFGDSTSQTFTSAPFGHQYNKQGSFGVNLKVTDSYGCTDSIYKPNLITIAQPVAQFMVPDTLFCPNTTITFSNLTAGLNNTYLWHFGDSTTSTDLNPQHAYQKEGKYIVKLVVTNQYGCADSSVSYINIIKTTSSFSMSDSVINCPPVVVNFTNTAKGFTSLEWDFDSSAKSTLTNPSHFYTAPATYLVKLLVKNNSGCADSSTRTILVKGPNGVFNYLPLTICAPQTINFTANVSTAVKFLWSYQDGNTDSTAKDTVSHLYTKGGTYLPKLIVEDSSGCQFVISGKDTIVANDIKTSITADRNVLCDSGTVYFSNNTVSLQSVTAYNWSFGDGTTSSLASPGHTFATAGEYTVTLEVTSENGCTDTASTVIKVAKTTIPSIIAQSSACSADSIPISAQIINDTSAITKWNWNFGNGKSSSLQFPPTQYYNVPGNYNTSLSVTNSSGCVSTVTKEIVINPFPSLKVSPDTVICVGNTASLSVSGTDSYAWISPDNTLSCTNCSNPKANPANNITYYVKGTSLAGCSSIDSVFIKVSQLFKVTVSTDTNNVCSGKSVQLMANGAPNYLWSPLDGLSSSSIANPLATPKTTTTYEVIGYDATACRNDTNSVTITVYDNPKVDLGPDKTITSRSFVVLTPSVSNDVTKFMWTPSTGLSCTDCLNPGFITTNNITYKLVVENAHCYAEDDINIIIKYNNTKVVIPNAFSPNGDGINDVFYPTGSDASYIKSFAIFNRWGSQIFAVNNVSGNDPASGWNGTWKGKPAEVGVYYYIIEVIGTDNKVIKYTGSVTLLR